MAEAPGSIIAILRFRLRPQVGDEFHTLHSRMVELVTAMPGFIGLRDYAGSDGEYCTVVEFASEEARVAWREHPEHLAVQIRGREEFFASYEVTVCSALRQSSFRLGSV